MSTTTTILEPPIRILKFSTSNLCFTFIELITQLFNHSYNACFAIVAMIVGLLPLLEGLLILLRFILDKVLEINDTKTTVEKFYKTVVFFGELMIIFVMVSFIYTIILLPVFQLIKYSCWRVWGLVNG